MCQAIWGSPRSGTDQNPLQSFILPLENPGQRWEALSMMHCWYVPRRRPRLYYPGPLPLSSGHFPTPHITPLPISGAKLQLPTWGKLVQDSSTCGFKVNSFHRKKLNRKSTPFPTKNYQGTLEKGLILELELRNKKRSPENRAVPESKTMLRVRGVDPKDTEANN